MFFCKDRNLDYNLRKMTLVILFVCTVELIVSKIVILPVLSMNSLPDDIKESATFSDFKHKVKTCHAYSLVFSLFVLEFWIV